MLVQVFDNFMYNDWFILQSLLFIIIIIIGILIYRYKNEGDHIFTDASTYFIILMVMYVTMPAYIFHDSGKTLVGASLRTIRFNALYSLYFSIVLTGYYSYRAVISTNKRDRSCFFSCNMHLVRINVREILCVYGLISVYIAVVYILNIPPIKTLWTDRALASMLTTTLNNVYKVQFMFMVVASFIVYLSCRFQTRRFFVMLLPFVFIDLITTDRGFMYQAMMVFIFITLLTGNKIPVYKLVIISLFVAAFSVIRAYWQQGFEIGQFIIIPKELLNTTEASFLIINSYSSINPLDAIFLSIGKIFSPQLIYALFGSIPHVSSIISSESPLSFGLGGSFLSEVYSYKSEFMLDFYPVATIIYLIMINIVKRKGSVGMFVFLFYLVLTANMFRSGLIYNLMEPFYYCVFALSWYWLPLFLSKKTIKRRPLFLRRKRFIRA